MASLHVSSPDARGVNAPATTKFLNSRVKADLSREVHCVLGLPIDVVDLPTSLHRIRLAAAGTSPFLLSTPNLNFFVNARTDSAFRESVQVSDLCPPDGMPIVWIARLLGIPIKERVAGSDIFDALRSDTSARPPLRVFLFGGEKGVADKVATKLNAEKGGLECVGALCPGFGSIEEMSTDENIVMINCSDAQFLV